MQPPEPPRLFLVDGYALIYRAFFAMMARPLRTTRGENTSAAWGIVSFLQRLLANQKPEYIGWVHDSGLSFRNETYPDYKATREKLSSELQDDFDRGMERICALLAAYNIPVLTLEGYEADDVIGTLAARGVGAGLNVVVVSGDKDFQQLVRPGVWLLNPGRGGPASVDEHWVGVENGSERLGVPPERVVDYLALVGDTSDNVPGVPGIGEKTACELVTTYGSLEEILAHAGEITRKRPREALLAHGDRARLSKQLVTLRMDLDVALDLDRLRVRTPDHARLRDLFVELEFHTLVKDQGMQAPPPSPAEAVRYAIVDTLEGMRAAITRASAMPHIAINTETVLTNGSAQHTDPLRAHLVAVTIAVEPTEAYYFMFGHRNGASGNRQPEMNGGRRGSGDSALELGFAASEQSPPAAVHEEVAPMAPRNLPSLVSPEMAPLRELLEDDSVPKTAHNAKYGVLALRSAGITLRGIEFDTMLASYVLDPGRRSHGLGQLALEFLNHTMRSYEDVCGKGRLQTRFDETPPDCARDYACEKADIALRLRALLAPQIESFGVGPLFREVEMPLVHVLARMEAAGVRIDTTWFASLKERFRRERELTERAIFAAAGEEFNIASNPQLRTILFDKLGLPVRKKTATGASTDATVLQELAEEGHALPTLLMEYRELAKLENTYLDALPALVHPESKRIHTSFNQTVASTGRLSSSDPNLQNIPIRRELGRDIRRGFVPRPGWRFIGADYSQIELRLLAHLSRDPAFVDAFVAGGDIHRQTASSIFEVPIDAVTADMRARAKTINFATIYGQGPHALSRQLRIEHAEAKRFIEQYFERFSGIRLYLDSMVQFARDNGYVQTLFGRRRYIPDLRDRNYNIRAFGERTATNSPIQGSAADLIKVAMIRIDSALQQRKLQTSMLLQVHDEL
ncbi:MAG: DNA polymerase I, partial [Gemmatimonadaceae bacterium]